MTDDYPRVAISGWQSPTRRTFRQADYSPVHLLARIGRRQLIENLEVSI